MSLTLTAAADELPRGSFTERTREQREAMVGRSARIGDIVASGIEPGWPVGRIVAFFERRDTGRLGNVAVCGFDGVVRTGGLGIAWGGYCPREEWDGPTPNGLAGLLWPGGEATP